MKDEEIMTMEGENNMAEVTDFNVGANVKAARRLLKTYVNVGSSTEDWELVGKGVEESSIELNPNLEKVTDILGITESSITKWEPVQTLEPNTVRGGSKLNFKLHKIWEEKKPELLSQFDILLVYQYIGDVSTGSYEAEKQTGCTISITSLGGSANVDMPIEINYSNESKKGTVTYTDDKPAFSPAS